MYFVPDGTKKCGYYRCRACGMGFLDLMIRPALPCPYCAEEPDPEIGPGEEQPVPEETAVLEQEVSGEEVEKLDGLLSLALTGGDYEWL